MTLTFMGPKKCRKNRPTYGDSIWNGDRRSRKANGMALPKGLEMPHWNEVGKYHRWSPSALDAYPTASSKSADADVDVCSGGGVEDWQRPERLRKPA